MLVKPRNAYQWDLYNSHWFDIQLENVENGKSFDGKWTSLYRVVIVRIINTVLISVKLMDFIRKCNVRWINSIFVWIKAGGWTREISALR